MPTNASGPGKPPAVARPRFALGRNVPPLAPDLPHPPPKTLRIALRVGLLVLAGVAYVTGAPPFLSVSLLVLGLASLVLLWRSLTTEAQLAAAVDETTTRSRAELEALADRMWELQESEERFRGLIDALGDLVVHRDRDGRIVYVNQVFADLLGRDADSLAGRTLEELGIDVGIVPDAAFSDGECLSSTDVAIQSSSGARWYSWIELSVRDKTSEAVSHRAIARDISARKRAEMALISARERAEHASRAKSRFLATVSHEIRTPMNGIIGMAALLAETELTPEQRTYVGAISTSAGSLLALIEDLLDYSKIEAGRFEPELQPVSPRELAESVVELLAAKAYAKGIGIASFVAPDVPSVITADPGRLRQVLLNLVGNAVKFTERGGVTVTVTTDGQSTTPTIRFAVTDTGPGLRREDMARIFEEFEQVDGTSTRNHGGAGLGLAISRRIVESMGGSIDVRSKPGEGSEFFAELPMIDARSSAHAAAPALLDRTVTIVSGRAIEAEAIARTIRAHGGTATVVASIDEAMTLDGSSDAVLIDAAIEKNGQSQLERLRRHGYRNADAIILVAPTERRRVAEFRDAGYANFLVRPVRGETLLRVLTHRPGQPAKPETQKRPPSARSIGRELSILVAEDNEINAMLARAALTKAGHRVDVVGNGKAAVEAMTAKGKARHYDIVLMDLHMPVMDGLDAIAAIRRDEQRRKAAAVPIVVLSADSQEQTRHNVLVHGASGFVTKPLDPQNLVRTVEEQAAA
ncbi:MAG TPA: response regulator [Rhizobiales bacterium]|nr:response regulator [Hyphomicrobiales bacterium]